jgi:hypothetical protein
MNSYHKVNALSSAKAAPDFVNEEMFAVISLIICNMRAQLFF